MADTNHTFTPGSAQAPPTAPAADAAHSPSPGAMARLFQQERAQRHRDIATGKLLPASVLCRRRGMPAQALRAALQQKRLFALRGPVGELVFPAFFADPAYDVRSLERVCRALADLPGASKWDFFTQPRISLGGHSPLHALARGKVAVVTNLAHAFADE